MTRPDWVPEDVWKLAYGLSVLDDIELIALALLQAKNEGKREAAEIVKAYALEFGDPADTGPEVEEAARAILSSIEKEPK